MSTTVQHPLEGGNVAINCPLRFGSLRKNWTVTWIVENRNEDVLPTSGYHIRTEPLFQLVINNATINYEGAKFRCRANLYGRNEVVGGSITLNLYCKLTQGGDIPIYAVLRSSSLVKVLTCLIFALTLDQEYNFALTFD